jgi:CheY-like chemotaxis protein/nucleotide-binding universal stress UspA family protein
MNLLVGFDGGEEGRAALSLAKEYALLTQSDVYVVTSMKGGTSERQSAISKADQGLFLAKTILERSGVACITQLLVRNLSPGEDLVQFATENQIDHIFLGIRKKSRAQKTIMGSTSRYVILEASCPVHTIKVDIGRFGTQDLLKDRRVLVVDDEPDILATVEDLLHMCLIDTASSYEEAKNYLKTFHYDIVILDIMGVRGYDLLQITRKKEIPALMLTAHALSPENLKKSIQKGADSYIPKEEMSDLETHVADVLRSRIQGEKGYGAFLHTLKSIFEKSFGKDWKDTDREFWESLETKTGEQSDTKQNKPG